MPAFLSSSAGYALRAIAAAAPLTVLAGCATLPPNREADATIVSEVRALAAAHGFDGTILVGSPDGGEVHFSTRPDLDPNAVWRWASITKQLTAVLVMQEVAAGRLDLDATVGHYLPDWPGPTAGKIRVRDLLLHNSGLPQPDEDTPDADGVPRFHSAKGRQPHDSAYGFCTGKPRADAPAKYEYNTCDSIMIGEILAKVTGSTFDRLVADRFRDRLSLRSLGIYPLVVRPSAHVQPVGEYKDLDPRINIGVLGPSGAAYGTITDLYRFDRAFMSGRLVSAKLRETMWQSTKANGFYGFHQWIYPAPLKGCAGPVRIVERQGLIGGIEHRNYILPESGRVLIMFSRRRPTGLGDPYEGKGFAFDMLSAVACGITAPPAAPG